MARDEGKAAEYQERAQALRENARGILDDKTRRELLRQADECEAIAAALAGKLPRGKSKSTLRSRWPISPECHNCSFETAKTNNATRIIATAIKIADSTLFAIIFHTFAHLDQDRTRLVKNPHLAVG